MSDPEPHPYTSGLPARALPAGHTRAPIFSKWNDGPASWPWARREGSDPRPRYRCRYRCVPVPYGGRTSSYRGWRPHARQFPSVLPCIMTCGWEAGRDRPGRQETHWRESSSPGSVLSSLYSNYFDHALSCTRPRCKSLEDPVTASGREADEGICSGQTWVGRPARGMGEGQGPTAFPPRSTRGMVAYAFLRSLCI